MKKNDNGFAGVLKKLLLKIPGLDDIVLQDPYHVYKNIPMEVAIYDLNGNYKYVNYSYTRDEQLSKKMIGKKDQFYAASKGISIDSLQKRGEYFDRTLKEKKVIQFTEKLYFPSMNQTLYYKRICGKTWNPIYICRRCGDRGHGPASTSGRNRVSCLCL